MIKDSRMCSVNVIGEPHFVMDADLSLVYKDGKYGLMHTSKHDNKGGGCEYDRELILPCEYDNLFFVEIKYVPHLIAVQQGKQGLFCFEGCTNGCWEEIFVKKLIPCMYDRIEIGRENEVLFLYEGSRIACFHLHKGKVFAECEHHKELYHNWLLCINGDNKALWNTCLPAYVSSLATEDVVHLGTYELGDIFRLKSWDEREEDLLQQLIFCEYQGEGILFGPKARDITIHTKTDRKECSVVGIEMTFGNREDALRMETVNEIAGRTQI